MDITIHRPPQLAFHGGIAQRGWINVSWQGGSNIGLNFHLWDADIPRYQKAVAAFNSSLVDRAEGTIVMLDATFTPGETQRLIDIMERRNLSGPTRSDETDRSILEKLKAQTAEMAT